MHAHRALAQITTQVSTIKIYGLTQIHLRQQNTKQYNPEKIHCNIKPQHLNENKNGFVKIDI